jgi:RNA polymerase sigma factor (sigma-70 family)
MMSRDYCNRAELSLPGVPPPGRSSDALLSSFLRAANRAEADVLLETLICEHAQPLIKEIVRGSLHSSFSRSTNGRSLEDAEDIASGVVLKLLKRLDDLKAHPIDKGIPSFRDYVAVSAYNACHEYLRQKNPERSRLKNKLRYIVTRQEGLALWEGKNKAWLCGLGVWRDESRAGVLLSRVRYLCGDSPAPNSLAGRQLALSRNIVELVTAIFEVSGGPLALDDLVSLVAELWGVKDFPPWTDEGGGGAGDQLEHLPSAEVDPATKVEQRMQLAVLWEEICELPLPQRRALLLGLKDAGGRCLTILLADIRIASLAQISETLSMPAERLAELWNKIPLDDMSIAAHLGITREQVIHQRQSARRRLARRMRALS